MTFIQNDEFIIIIIDQSGGHYSVDDLNRLHDAGIQTVVRYPFWRDIERRWGVYDWGSVDKMVDEDRQAGLKTMLAIYEYPPSFFPQEWYLHRLDGTVFSYDDTNSVYDNVIVPWNRDGWLYHLCFMAECCRHSNAPDVLCYRSTLKGGSVMFPEFGGLQIEGEMLPTVLKMMRDEQERFLSHPSREIWTTLHPTFDKIACTGNRYRYEIYDMLEREFPEAVHHALTHAYFTDNGEHGIMAEIMSRYHFPMWCGSEYAEGLNVNTDTAIERGFRGFITAPLHYLSGHKALEPWMLDAIRNSLKKWKQHAPASV